MENYIEKEVGNYGVNNVISYPDFLCHVRSCVPNYMVSNVVSHVVSHVVSYIRIFYTYYITYYILYIIVFSVRSKFFYEI